MNNAPRFIVIDDDPITNMISARLIKLSHPDVIVTSFNDAVPAINVIRSEGNNSGAPTIVLLDVNMPGMDGWGFLDLFNGLGQGIRKNFRNYILFSTIDDRDKEKVAHYPSVADMLSKPLNQNNISMLLGLQ